MRVSNHKIADPILLKKAARDGCYESLAMIYRKYKQMICDFFYKAGADGMAEDICQSVFTHLREGKCKYDGGSEGKSYLFGVAKDLFKQAVKTDNIKDYSLSGVQKRRFTYSTTHRGVSRKGCGNR